VFLNLDEKLTTCSLDMHIEINNLIQNGNFDVPQRSELDENYDNGTKELF